MRQFNNCWSFCYICPMSFSNLSHFRHRVTRFHDHQKKFYPNTLMFPNKRENNIASFNLSKKNLGYKKIRHSEHANVDYNEDRDDDDDMYHATTATFIQTLYYKIYLIIAKYSFVPPFLNSYGDISYRYHFLFWAKICFYDKHVFACKYRSQSSFYHFRCTSITYVDNDALLARSQRMMMMMKEEKASNWAHSGLEALLHYFYPLYHARSRSNANFYWRIIKLSFWIIRKSRCILLSGSRRKRYFFPPLFLVWEFWICKMIKCGDFFEISKNLFVLIKALFK